MWIHISRIAKEHQVPEQPLASFAMKNPTRYSVIVDSKGPKIETAQVDKLVAEFRSLLAAHKLPADRR